MRAVVLLAVLACVAVALSGAAMGAEARTLQRRLEAALDGGPNPKAQPKAAPVKAKAKAKAKAQPKPKVAPAPTKAQAAAAAKAQPAPGKPATKDAATAAAPAAATKAGAAPATAAPATAATATPTAATKVAPKAKAKRLVTVKRLATIKGVSIAEKEYQRHFSNFMRKHHRVYKAEDVTKRYAQYKQNWKFIDNFNKLKDEDKTFSLATNQFSDHSTDEFKKKLGFRSARRFAPQAVVANAAIMEGLKTTAPSGAARDAEKAALAKDAGVGKIDLPGAAASPAAAAAAPAGAAASTAAPAARFRSIPASKNWADDPNVVSPIRMQGTCGSCWSFATASVVESANAILTGVLIPAAPQHLLDCCSGTTWAPCDGCNGGDFMTAYRFVTQNGMCAWADYPYTGVAPAKCKTCTSVNWISGGQVVAQAGDEVSLMAAVNNGPVATAVMANLPTFQFYSAGVYNDVSCPKDFESLDHAVVLTGYGTTTDGQDYWWLRNTWDTIWGEKGYMRLARGSNACGVALEATQPVARLNPASNTARQQHVAKQEAEAAKANAAAGASTTPAATGSTDATATATTPAAADPNAQWTDPSQAAGTPAATAADPNANAYDYQSTQQPTADASAGADYGSNQAYSGGQNGADQSQQWQQWQDYN